MLEEETSLGGVSVADDQLFLAVFLSMLYPLHQLRESEWDLYHKLIQPTSLESQGFLQVLHPLISLLPMNKQ